MRHVPDFDELVGDDVPAGERDRLRRTHDLLVQAAPPPELSPDLEAVPWPEDSLQPFRTSRRRRPVLLAAAVLTLVGIGFVVGQATAPNSSTSLQSERTIRLAGTRLDRDANATLELGNGDRNGNWPLVLHVNGLDKLPKGGYYDLYLTKGGKPVVLCGTFNVAGRQAVIRLSAAYDLSHFDRNGWVVTRQLPGQFEPTDVVLKPL